MGGRPELSGRRQLSQAQRDRVQGIARAQKAVLACVPMSLGMRVVIGVASGGFPLDLPLPITCAAFAVAILTALCIGCLVLRLFGPVWGVLAGLLALVPYLALFPLLLSLFAATSVLARRGVRVGLLGAKLREN
jgi:hypothetical protein